MTLERVLIVFNEPVLPATHPDYVSEVEVLDNVEAMKFMLDKFRHVKNHDEFFKMMVGGGK